MAKQVLHKHFRDIEVSTLGFGGTRWAMEEGNNERIDRKKGFALIDAALERGINYFDTAHAYLKGDSERIFGEALTRHPRESYLLASKFHASHCKDLEGMFEEQLKRCRVEYFAFYLFHCVCEVTLPLIMDENARYLEFLLKQKEKSRIRYLGFSAHAEPDNLRKFLQWYDGYDMAQIQLNYVDWTLLKAKEQYDILLEHQLPVWVMEPQKGGRLSTLNERAAAILKAAEPERSIPSWSFRFLQGLPMVQTVLSGMTTMEQIEDNVDTFSRQEPLNEQELDTLWQAKDAFMGTLGVPCSGCRYCCDTCPAGLNIPLLIQGYNEQRVSGEGWRLSNLKWTKGPEECLHCNTCRQYCPQRIDIPEVLAQYAALRAAL